MMVWRTIAQYRTMLTRMQVMFDIDNLVTVCCLKRGTSRAPPLMRLVKWIWLMCYMYDIRLVASHIAGVDNVRPDLLSRGAQPTLAATDGRCALHAAAAAGHVRACELLLSTLTDPSEAIRAMQMTDAKWTRSGIC